MPSMNNLFRGVVVETTTKSLLGPYFYSDKMHDELNSYGYDMQPRLNEWASIRVVAVAAGIMRMILATIHSVGHLLAAALTLDKGHLYHAAKGGCEFLRGMIEATPFIGRKFSKWYFDKGEWWILKIYNPNSPDSLDLHANCWKDLKQNRPKAYVIV